MGSARPSIYESGSKFVDFFVTKRLTESRVSARLIYMSKNKNRRAQSSKPAKSGNTEYMYGMQELRRSNAAGSHKTAKDYRRKPKHVGRGWE